MNPYCTAHILCSQLLLFQFACAYMCVFICELVYHIGPWSRVVRVLSCRVRSAHCSQADPRLSTNCWRCSGVGSSWTRPPARQQERRPGDRSIIPSAQPSRNCGPGEAGAMGRFSGLWPRVSIGCVGWSCREVGPAMPGTSRGFNEQLIK